MKRNTRFRSGDLNQHWEVLNLLKIKLWKNLKNVHHAETQKAEAKSLDAQIAIRSIVKNVGQIDLATFALSAIKQELQEEK